MLMEPLDAMRAMVGMSRAEFLSTAGAGVGFLGGLLLAYAGSRELAAHRLAINGLQVETAMLIEAFANPTSDLIQVLGTDKHIKAGERCNNGLTRAGIFLLAVSLALTVWALFVPTPLCDRQPATIIHAQRAIPTVPDWRSRRLAQWTPYVGAKAPFGSILSLIGLKHIIVARLGGGSV